MNRVRRGIPMRGLVSVILTVGLLGGAVPAHAAWRIDPPKVSCRDRDTGDRPEVRDLVIPVRGQRAHGLYAVPDGKPTGLVVFAHGYGHTSHSWARHLRAAARHGLIAAAMDYRGLEISPDANGDGLPESRGWPSIAGAEDSIAAARLFDTKCRPPVVTILGVSMGGNISGLAVAMAGERGITRHDGSPLWDYWMDVEGAVNLTETYLEARAVAPVNASGRQAQDDIERETGCPIEACPDEFLRRTVPARMDDVVAAGLEGAIVIHGVDDGLVPYNQGREMATALALSAIPAEMITVGTKDSDSERETTLTGYVGSNVDPNYRSPLAGHASEKSTTHIVMETALDRLWRLMEGQAPPPYRECTANGTGGDHPTVACTP